MKIKLAVDAANNRMGQDAVHHPASEQFQRNGKPVVWCDSCESYMPRHTCEWKILASVVFGAALVCVIYMWGLFSGLW